MMSDNINGIEYIRGEEIKEALQLEYRQYLVGKLMREQKHLKHIKSDIEIGISFYSEFTANVPHKHPIATEYVFVLKGKVKVLMLDGTDIEQKFQEGDFFVIKRDCAYASKNAPNTEVLFIKAPGGNDKTYICIDQKTRDWLDNNDF